MKLTTTRSLTLLLSSSLALAAPAAFPLPLPLPNPDVISDDWANAAACGGKNPNINTAIEQFCGANHDGLAVPSDFASGGVSYGGIKVSIVGLCNPPQWVPVQYCISQFHQVCAASWAGDGTGVGWYGWNGAGQGNCQKWNIEHA